jgi:hypothetical protein
LWLGRLTELVAQGYELDEACAICVPRREEPKEPNVEYESRYLQ